MTEPLIPALLREPARRRRSAIGKISVRDEQLDPACDRDDQSSSYELPKSAFEFAAYLAGHLKWEMSHSQHECRLRRRAATVGVFEYARPDADSRIAFDGTASCKSPLCPCCVLKWQVTRCEEIKLALDNWEAKHGEGCAKFVTLTPRHNRGMALGLLHRLNTKAFGDFYSGRKGQKFARLISGFVHPVESSENACAGIGADTIAAPTTRRRWRRPCSSGEECSAARVLSDPIDQEQVPFTRPESIRAHDQTWSRVHGWHPHLHALVFLAWQGESDQTLEDLFFVRWNQTLIGALRAFKKFVARVLARETCAVFGRHARRLARYASAADAPEACSASGAGWVQTWGDAVVMAHASSTECCAGARELDGVIASPAENTRRNRERIRRPASSGELCRQGEPRRNPEPEDQIRQSFEWQTICGVASCPACAAGVDCPHTRDRAEKLFGVRIVRRHVPLLDAMRVVDRALKKFKEKELRPRRSYGTKLETVRDPAKMDDYLTKLGAMGFELAFSTTKRPSSAELGTLKSDGHRHYGKWEVGLIATLRRDPLKELCRRDWGELFRGTFGTQMITFSSRDRLGLGPDPYADDQEPDEQREGETKRFWGDILPDRWDPNARELGHDWLIEIERAYREGRLFQYVEAPTEAYERARGPPAFGAEALPTPPSWRERLHETSEAFRRALDPLEAEMRIEARRNTVECAGEGVPADSDFGKRKALRELFAEMRRQHEAKRRS